MTSIKAWACALVLCLAGCAQAPSSSDAERNAPRGSAAGSDADVPGLQAALPVSEVANAAIDRPLDRREAWRLLDQGTFGPRLDDVERTSGAGTNAWIDAQMSLPVTWMLPALRESDRTRWNAQVNVWWRHALMAEDQLRQRVAFALSQIFVVSGKSGLGGKQEGIANYYDLLLRHAFGNYRELIEAITLNPVMGEYLSMKGNSKPDPSRNIRPDENYARELLQLFSIGLERLNPDGTPQRDADGVPLPTYDQATVEGFAHVFTGWHFASAERFSWPKKKDYLSPMRAWPEYHDDGEKLILDGARIPPGQTPEQDLAMALDAVAAHPNVGPFLARQLIQRLVTSNPSTDYVRDVAAVFDSNAAGERGNLGSTIKAILSHREAREGHLIDPDTFGKVREPLLRVTQLWRAFRPSEFPERFNYTWSENELAQAPLNAPSVFNFFRPDFSQPGVIDDAGLVSPEFEILDESSMVTLTSRLSGSSLWNHNHKSRTNGQTVTIDIDREVALVADPEALLDHLDMAMLGGRMSLTLRDETRRLMQARTRSKDPSLAVSEAIFLIATSPEAAIQY